MYAQIVLYKLGALWLHHHTEAQVVLLTDESHHYLYLVDVVAILREAAQVAIEIVLQRLAQVSVAS